MPRVRKGNRELTIEEHRLDAFLSQGYDQVDPETGKILKKGEPVTLTDFKNKLIKYLQIEGKIPANYQDDDIHIYQYERPKYHINGYEMRQHIDHSKKINI